MCFPCNENSIDTLYSDSDYNITGKLMLHHGADQSYLNWRTFPHWYFTKTNIRNISFDWFITARKQSCSKVMFHRCLSVHKRGEWIGTSYASWDRSHGKVPSPIPSPRHQTWGPTPSPPLDIRPGDLLLPCHWQLVVISGDLFKLVQLRIYMLWHWDLVVATETCMLGKWVVWILLECCLVSNKNAINWSFATVKYVSRLKTLLIFSRAVVNSIAL